MLHINDVRRNLNDAYLDKQFVGDTVELVGVSFLATDDTIFGTPNNKYIHNEIKWYLSKSRSVDDIPGVTPTIWKNVACRNGFINSNYGWCIFSNKFNQYTECNPPGEHNHNQYEEVKSKLKSDPQSRQAVMIYTRPTMHTDSNDNDRKDFMCTNTVQYLIRNNKLDVIVNMRSNDAVFGYKNDYAWQKFVQIKLADELNIEHGTIYWQVGSLHVYSRHFYLIDEWREKQNRESKYIYDHYQ